MAAAGPLRRLPAAALRAAGARCAGAAPGLLAQLPDFAAGARALEAGRLAEAQLPLERAVEVAEAYFPPAAARERALCHAALGRCLWRRGRPAEAAAQFEAGLQASRDQAATEVSSCLAASAARMWFELGKFELAGPLAAEARELAPGAEAPALLAEALAAAEGRAPAAGAAGAAGAAVARLLAAALPEEGGPRGEALEWELAEGRPLARLLAAEGPPTRPLLAARAAAGQLAVAAGRGAEPWARPLLVRALDDYEALQPTTSPTYAPLLFQTLGALGTLTGASAGDAIAAEGLFTSAVDHIEKAMHGPLVGILDGPRGRIWRARVFCGFADLLEQGRRAEQRRSEIAALRGRAAEALGRGEEGLSPRQLRWALAPAPALEPLRAEEVLEQPA